MLLCFMCFFGVIFIYVYIYMCVFFLNVLFWCFSFIMFYLFFWVGGCQIIQWPCGPVSCIVFCSLWIPWMACDGFWQRVGSGFVMNQRQGCAARSGLCAMKSKGRRMVSSIDDGPW